MIETDVRKSLIDRITKSKEFHNATKYIDLLNYLVDMSAQKIIPDQKEISQHVFQKGDDFDPFIDTSVRVYIYRLRKKLENYYLNEGKFEKILLVIPKGEYYIEFIEKSSIHIKSIPKYIKSAIILLSLLLILSIATIIFLWKQYHSFQNSCTILSKNDEIWGPFLNTNRPILLVLGDHFFFVSRENDDYETVKFIRYHKVNSLNDFEQFCAQNKNPNIVFYKTVDYFLDRYCTWSLLDILPIFYGHQKNVILKIASEVTWNDFQNYHIIFVGSFKTLGIMESLFPNLKIHFELFPLPNKIIVSDTLNNISGTYNIVQSKIPPLFQREYSYIAKIPGPNKNTILLLCGFNYIGVENAVKLVTDPGSLSKCKNNLIKTFNILPTHFEMLYQVEGFARTSMYTNFLHSFIITEDYKITKP